MRALVLALGNLAPTPPPVLAGLSGDVLRTDPWGPTAIEGWRLMRMCCWGRA
jgi:hypothetical protein